MLRRVELGPDEPEKRCDKCGQPTRCGAETIGSVGPSYFWCIDCLLLMLEGKYPA